MKVGAGAGCKIRPFKSTVEHIQVIVQLVVQNRVGVGVGVQ